MAQSVECPNCAKILNLPDTAAGKKVKCSGCESVSRIHATDGGTLFLELLDDGPIMEATPAAPVRGRAASPGASARTPTRGAGGVSPRSARGGSHGGGRAPEGATTVFIIGLLSLVLCQIMGPIAWYMGADYAKRCKRARVRPDGLATAGMVLGIVATVLLVLTIVYIAVVGAIVLPHV